MSTLSWAGQNLSFPYGYTVSIQKEFERNGDGTPLAEKHSINIRGSIAASASDATVRYNSLITSAASFADTASAIGDARQIGTLTLPDGTTYDNATLTNVSSSEPPDDTAAIHYIDISLSFEAYASSNLTDYKLKSVSETVDIRKEEDRSTFNDDDINSDVYFGYTVTHTLNAQGYLTNGIEAYTEAKKWIEDRLKSTSVGLILEKNAYGKNLYENLTPDDDYQIGTPPPDEYNAIRTTNADTLGGSYSITTTYFRSKSKSISEVTVDFSKDENGDVSISANGTIQGLSSIGPDSVIDNKYSNAESSYSTICGNFRSGSRIYTAVSNVFNLANTESVSLDDYPLVISTGQNKLKGSITFNVTYKAYPTAVLNLINAIPGAISATMSITDDNKNGNPAGDVQIYAAIPIIGRSAGPILQDMATTRERRRTIQVDATVDATQRSPTNTAVVNACFAQILLYAPAGSKIFRNNVNSSWDFTSGRASASVEWTYQP